MNKSAKLKISIISITEMEKTRTQQEQKIHDYLMQLPNLLDETVPLGKDSNDNVQVKTWGTIPQFSFPVKNHIDLALELGQIDMERAGKISGARFFYLKHDVSPIRYGVDEFCH